MSVRLIHTADWQIGKVFADLHDCDSDRAPLLKEQRFLAVERIARLAHERQADCVIVAGDVFDSQDLADETLRRTINATEGFGGPWLLLPGNHDAALPYSVWTRLSRLGLPQRIVPLLAPKPVLFAQKGFAVLPAPLVRRHETLDVSDVLDAQNTPQGVIRVGVAHGSVKGRLPNDSDAKNEIAADRAVLARLDYLALGDWHGTKRMDERTYYSGTPETDRFRDPSVAEQCPSGQVLFVQIEGPGCVPVIEAVPTGHYVFLKEKCEMQLPSDVDVLWAKLGKLSAPEKTLVDLTLFGSLGLADEQRLREGLASWRARFHLLRLHDSGLQTEYSDEDLDFLPSEPGLRTVAHDLRQKILLPGEDGLIARLALKQLLSDVRRVIER